MALGEMIGEVNAKVSGMRYLGDKIETSTQDTGKFWGVEGTGLTTFTSTPRPDGTMWGEGGGLMQLGSEAIMFRGTGIGRPGKGMAGSFRGVIYFNTMSQKFAKANGTVCVYEYDI